MYLRSRIETEEESWLARSRFLALPATEHVVIDSWATTCHWPTHPARFSLKFALDGQEFYQVQGRPATVGQGRFLVVNAGQPYTSYLRSPAGVQSFTLYFEETFLHQTLRELAPAAPALLEADWPGPGDQPLWFAEQSLALAPEMNERVRRLQNSLRLGGLPPFALEEQLHGLLTAVVDTAQQHTARHLAGLTCLKPSTRRELYRRLHEARAFLEAYAETPLTLSAVARAATLSKTQLLRHFPVLFACSPYQYLTRLRLAHARRLLLTSALPVQEIVGLAGFECPSSFGRLFKAAFQAPPGQYRARYLK